MTKSKAYCKYCFNARIYEPVDENDYYTPITEENDFGASIINNYNEKGRRLFFEHGNGEAPRIMADEWSEKQQQWVTTAIYYPKYCPECGRKIDEYDKETHR